MWVTDRPMRLRPRPSGSRSRNPPMPTPLDRPRLRPGLAAARDDRDPHSVVIFDQFRLTRQLLRVSPREFTWLQWLDGSNTLRDVQVAAMRESGGTLVPIELLLALVE